MPDGDLCFAAAPLVVTLLLSALAAQPGHGFCGKIVSLLSAMPWRLAAWFLALQRCQPESALA